MRGCRAAVWGPVLLVTAPLVGRALITDERVRVWQRTLDGSAWPWGAYSDTASHNDSYLEFGNFRPLGRFWETWVHGLSYEVGELTSVPPHVVLGVVRVAMLALLAVVGAAMVSALARSAGVSSEKASRWWALALAAVLLAGGVGALTQFPHTMIGAVVLVCGVCLLVCRERDIQRGPLRWFDVVALAGMGLMSATFYDTAFAAVPVSAAYVAAHGVAARISVRDLARSAATRRWVAHSAGFAVAFVAGRLLIAATPPRPQGRYAATEAVFSLDAVSAALPRLATGFPVVGWLRSGERAAETGLRWIDLLRDPASVLVLAALTWFVATAIAKLRVGAQSSPAEGHQMRRLGVALLLVGATVAVSGAAIAGLSAAVQAGTLPVRVAWRETLLVQLGWSMIAAGVASGVLGALRRAVTRRVAVGAGTVLLAVALPLGLLANWRAAESQRRQADDAAISLISAAAMLPADDVALGVVRCNLARAWVLAAPPSWRDPELIIADIDRLWANRYGITFCDPDHGGP